eukprot:GEMP01000118.1.p1 GENE.GEMP01000118.1~~GEMP01000118.1.p1  ORF type:complete len:2993 (+),score=738.26 GEMP01000118.1:230-9208(+)
MNFHSSRRDAATFPKRHYVVFHAETINALTTRFSDTALDDILIAAWAILLCRHTDQDTIVVGVDSSAVPKRMMRAVIAVPRDAPFVNVLNTVVGARSEVAIQVSPNSEDGGRSAPTLCHTRFSLDTNGTDAHDDIEQQQHQWGDNKDVAVAFRGYLGQDGDVNGVLTFSADAYTEDAIRLFQARYAHLLSHLSTIHSVGNAKSVWHLPILPQEELRHLLESLNDTAAPCPWSATTLHAVCHRVATQYPHCTAVECGATSLTYAEFDRAATKLAHTIQHTYKVRPGTLCAVYMRKSCALAVGLLGILKAQMGFVPMDVEWPMERVRFIVNEDSRCRVLITDQLCHDQIRTHFAGTIIVLDDVSIRDTTPTSILSANEEHHEEQGTPSDIAFVIYTSGSTGTPKGVRVPHRGVLNLMHHIIHTRRDVTQGDIFAAAANICFDAFAFGFFLSILSGTTARLLEPRALVEHAEPTRTHDTHEYGLEGCTAMFAVPSALSVAVVPRSMKVIVCGGEALSLSVVSNVPPSVTLLNGYGPTEASMCNTIKRVDRTELFHDSPTISEGLSHMPRENNMKQSERLHSIGRPTANVTCYVVDPETVELQPSGVYGELLIGGIQVADGYLNRPELTAEKFIPHPWLPKTRHFSPHSNILYRTGDLVRYFPDGELEFHGRIDFQVKLRGYRIELGDIEHALLAQDAHMRDAVVLLREQVLVAYVHPQACARDTVEIQARLRVQLPHYMVPTVFVGVDSWPRSSSGKIDRKKLPPPPCVVPSSTILSAPAKHGRPSPRQQYTFPTQEETSTTEDETVLVVRRAFASVLNIPVETIPNDASLFDLGGNSLSAMQVVAQLRTNFSLRVATVLRHPSARALAASLVENTAQHAPSVSVRTTSGAGDNVGNDEEPVSQNITQILTQCAMGTMVNQVYNLLLPFWLRGEVNQHALWLALKQVVHRHAPLRTTFIRSATTFGFTQHVRDVEKLPASWWQVTHCPNEQDAIMLMQREADTPHALFDNSCSSVFRVHFITVMNEHDNGGHRSTNNMDVALLVINVHHVAFDGASRAILTHELSSYYAHYAHNGTFPLARACLPSLTCDYLDFTRCQQSLLADGGDLSNARAYWRANLTAGSVSALSFPCDDSTTPRPPMQTFCGATVPCVIPPHIVAQLDQLRAVCTHGTTMFHLIIAMWALCLARTCGQTDIVVGVPYHGRDVSDTKNYALLIGYFVNVLPLRINVARNTAFIAYVNHVRDVIIGAIEHSGLPFTALVARDVLPDLARDPSRTPLFQTMCSWEDCTQHGQVVLPQLGDAIVEDAHGALAHTTALMDISWFATREVGGDIRGCIEFNTDIYSAATIERLAVRLGMLAEQIAQNVGNVRDGDVWRINVLPQAEEEFICAASTGPHAEVPREGCVHDLICYDDLLACAIEYEDCRCTYEELGVWSTALQREFAVDYHLREGTLVALQLRKSVEMIVTMIALWKLGCAFLPLDPTWPENRRAFIVNDDAKCTHFICHREFSAELAQFFTRTIIVLDDAYAAAMTRTPARTPETACCTPVDPRATAYVIYTSGSSGTPKGVPITHVSAVNVFLASLTCHAAIFPFHAKDRVAIAANYVFDAFLFSTCMALCTGGTVCLLPSYVDLAAPRGRNGDDAKSYNVLDVVPSVLPHVAAHILDPMALRLIISGGEALTQNALASVPITIPFVNVYGPTETTIQVTYKQVKRQCLQTTTSRPRASQEGGHTKSKNNEVVCDLLHSIGRPTANVTTYVVDPETLALQPIGVYGELLIGGVQVAGKYLNRPSLSAEKFISHPYPNDTTASAPLVYRTGDLVRLLANMDLEFRGRIDFQVKLRGVRVELGEIEHALTAHPAVAEAVVIVRTDMHDSTEPMLVAYVQWKEPTGVDNAVLCDVNEVLHFVRGKIPAYMVPSVLVGMTTAWIRTSSDKIDRTRLPLPSVSSCAPPGTGVRDGTIISGADMVEAAHTARENMVRELFAHVLQRREDAISCTESFFHYGGTSLSAMRTTSLLQECVPRVNIPLDILFRCPTVREVARFLKENDEEEGAAKTSSVSKLGHVTPMRPSRRVAPREASATSMLHISDTLLNVGDGLSQPKRTKTHLTNMSCRAGQILFDSGVIVFAPLFVFAQHVPVIAVIAIMVAIVPYIPSNVFLPSVLCAALVAEPTIHLLAVVQWVVLKWLLVARLPTGIFAGLPFTQCPSYGDSLVYIRYWLGRRIHDALRPTLEYFRGSHMLHVIFRLLGAKVHMSSVIDAVDITDWDAISIGSHAVLQEDCTVSAAVLTRQQQQPLEEDTYSQGRTKHQSGAIASFVVLAIQRVHVDATIQHSAHVCTSVSAAMVVSPLSTTAKKGGQASLSNVAMPAWYTWGAATIVTSVMQLVAQAAALGIIWALVRATGTDPIEILRPFFTAGAMPTWHVAAVITIAHAANMFLAAPVFVCIVIFVRLVAIRKVRSADRRPERMTLGSLMLVKAQRHTLFLHVIALLDTLNASKVLLRMLGARIEDMLGASYVPFPKVDSGRCELITLGPEVVFGGQVYCCTAARSEEGIAIYDEVTIEGGTLVANGVVLMAGVVVGPNAILGNRSCGIARNARHRTTTTKTTRAIGRTAKGRNSEQSATIQRARYFSEVPYTSALRMDAAKQRRRFSAPACGNEVSFLCASVNIGVISSAPKPSHATIASENRMDKDDTSSVDDKTSTPRHNTTPASNAAEAAYTNGVWTGSPPQFLFPLVQTAATRASCGASLGTAGAALLGKRMMTNARVLVGKIAVVLAFVTGMSLHLMVYSFIPIVLTLLLVRYSLHLIPLCIFLIPWCEIACAACVGVFIKRIFVGKLHAQSAVRLGGAREGLLHAGKTILHHIDRQYFTCVKGSWVYNAWMRLLGARCGTDIVWLGNMCPEGDMLRVGNGTVVGPGVDFFTHNIEHGEFTCEPITIEDNCMLGERSAVMGYSVVNEGAELLPCAQGMKGMHFRAHHTYDGNPANGTQKENAKQQSCE